MAKSKSNFNKMATLLNPDAIVDLYEIDFSNLQADFELLEDVAGVNIGADSIYRFCPMKNSANPIYWQGNGYQPLPVESEGFEQQGDGRLPRPKITLANPDGLLSKIVHANHDFSNCKVTRKRTFVRFLDNDNFIDPGTKNSDGKNPFGEADPDSHFPDDVYYINRKVSENKNVIQFELVSALELKGSEVPARIVMPNYCGWVYRCSIGCGYAGLPIETLDGQSLISGFNNSKESPASEGGLVNHNIYSDAQGRPADQVPEWSRYGSTGSSENFKGYDLGDVVKITPKKATNPYQSTPVFFVCCKTHVFAKDHPPFFDNDHWLKDECSKTLAACKKRFGFQGYNDMEINFEKYVLNQGDLLKAYNDDMKMGNPPRSKSQGLSMADWGERHYISYGAKEIADGGRPWSSDWLDDGSVNRNDFTKANKHSGLKFGGFPGTDKYQPE